MGLVAAPAPAAKPKAKQFPVKVAFTDVFVGLQDQEIAGKLTSAKGPCASGRTVRLTDGEGFGGGVIVEGGEFVVTGWFGFVSGDLTASVGKKMLGKRKFCKSDRAVIDLTVPATTVAPFEFDSSTNTFSGTISSPAAECIEGRNVDIRDDAFVYALGVTNNGGNFSTTLGGPPDPNTFYAFANPSLGSATFRANGDAEAIVCNSDFSAPVATGP